MEASTAAYLNGEVMVTVPANSEQVMTPTMTLPERGNFSFALFFFVVLSSLGMVGNAVVCLVMLRNRKVFNSTTNKLIIHQSTIDSFGSIIFLTRRFALITPPVPAGFLTRLYCRIWWSEWVQYSMFVTSTYNLAAISAERYLATCHPVRHRNMFSPCRLKLLLLVPWLAGWLPAAHVVVLSFYDSETLDCGIAWPSLEAQAAGGVLIFLQEMVIPLTIMVFTYSRITWSLQQRSRVRQGENNAAAREMFSKANRNVTITLIVVAVFFVVCWLPNEVYYLLYNLSLQPNFINDPVYEVTSVFVVLNLCINPFIYAFAYERFRKKLLEMLCCRYWSVRRINVLENRTGVQASTVPMVSGGPSKTIHTNKAGSSTQGTEVA
ncbi:somatostatin receptor type 2-like [Acanthaster planci]|uniref:Somatostatin receptor type 2-like n=1 Tax=Acanthaster planci TaxID=133434 RepID=A0A8B7XHZ8_ACAPL|nr:somatostatin receptor type 2-like [Acanthaster planci]